MDLYGDYDALFAAAALVFAIIAIAGGLIAYLLWSWFAMRLYDKAGVQGRWRAWVPVYSQMIFLKLGDVNPWLFLFHFAWIVPFVGEVVGGLASLGVTVLMFMAAYRIGLKLGKDPAFTVLFILAPIWLGIVAFDSSRWNPQVPPAPWAGTGFFRDGTRWEGIPAQATAAPGSYAAGGYGSPAGYGGAPAGYPDVPPGPPSAPTPPSAPPYGSNPPGPPTQPPAPRTQPPAPPTQPPTPPPAPPTPPTQPPA